MKTLQGVITSNKMQKTVVVRVDRLRRHPKYQKFFRISKKFKAHDEKGEFGVGDTVMIQETRPLSREKHWRVATLVRRAASPEETPVEQENQSSSDVLEGKNS